MGADATTSYTIGGGGYPLNPELPRNFNKKFIRNISPSKGRKSLSQYSGSRSQYTYLERIEESPNDDRRYT